VLSAECGVNANSALSTQSAALLKRCFVLKIPIQYQKRRDFKPRIIAPPPVALVLSAASYVSGVSLTLTFSRAINVAGLSPTQITFRDATQERTYRAGTVSTPSANVAQFTLVQIGMFAGGGYLLNATASNGIVATNDGSAWAGVANRSLPFP